MAKTVWRTFFWDEVRDDRGRPVLDKKGNPMHSRVKLIDDRRPVCFTWVQRNLGISRQTLYRARLAGTLRVFPNNPSMTRTDWLYLFITGRR